MNPGCSVFPNTHEVSKRLGTIHVAMGDNISLDGKVLLKDGKLYL